MWFIIRYNNGTIFLTDDEKSIKISISWKKISLTFYLILKKVYKFFNNWFIWKCLYFKYGSLTWYTVLCVHFQPKMFCAKTL